MCPLLSDKYHVDQHKRREPWCRLRQMSATPNLRVRPRLLDAGFNETTNAGSTENQH